MIVGLIAADAGSVMLDGQELRHLPIHERARLGVGYLPQEASIFRKMTVEQNIRKRHRLYRPSSLASNHFAHLGNGM